MTTQISEEDIQKVEFIKTLLEIEPKNTKAPKMPAKCYTTREKHKSMIEFPADPTLIGNSHEKPRRVFGNTFVQKSETTKAWDAINRDMEKYPELANQLKTTPEEVYQMRKMHSLRDQLIYFGTEYENAFGNSMVKDPSHEKFEVTLKNLMNQFQALNIVQPRKTESVDSNLTSSKNASISNNPYLVNNSKKIKTETLS
ncbi:hypothetical protein C2G38_2030247 [Gigaspora rosea]|uniref:Uncharacterized protein n=1 Tax=Gigaspora rosea TaxID=44941 RepID=A0A397VX35_9GLOM|nr:hypothetical protein C2G38_2030247 [Gigaspora rosea]